MPIPLGFGGWPGCRPPRCARQVVHTRIDGRTAGKRRTKADRAGVPDSSARRPRIAAIPEPGGACCRATVSACPRRLTEASAAIAEAGGPLTPWPGSPEGRARSAVITLRVAMPGSAAPEETVASTCRRSRLDVGARMPPAHLVAGRRQARQRQHKLRHLELPRDPELGEDVTQMHDSGWSLTCPVAFYVVTPGSRRLWPG